MSEGRGGHWNRAGRRSGGSRPVPIDIPRLRDGETLLHCPQCGNNALPLFVTRGCEVCNLVVAFENARAVGNTDAAIRLCERLLAILPVDAGVMEVGRLASDPRADARRATEEDAG